MKLNIKISLYCLNNNLYRMEINKNYIPKYLTAKRTKKILGVHIQTLYNWEKKLVHDVLQILNGLRKYKNKRIKN